MIIYGLSGKSGTGKSYQAMNVCRSRDIRAIIDDGLFIYDSTVRAGHSAKRDDNRMTAIKTAVFASEDERREVSEKIREINPSSILILGTSDKMVEKIAARLELPPVHEMIHIEDIADQDMITTALRQRREKGRHVIPVPTLAVKKQFSGYFMMPFKKLGFINGRTVEDTERTIVRPAYSYLGKFFISEKVICEIVHHSAVKAKGVHEVVRCSAENSDAGVLLSVSAVFRYEESLMDNVESLQRAVSDAVEYMTAFNILGVDVQVRGLV